MRRLSLFRTLSLSDGHGPKGICGDCWRAQTKKKESFNTISYYYYGGGWYGWCAADGQPNEHTFASPHTLPLLRIMR